MKTNTELQESFVTPSENFDDTYFVYRHEIVEIRVVYKDGKIAPERPLNCIELKCVQECIKDQKPKLCSG